MSLYDDEEMKKSLQHMQSIYPMTYATISFSNTPFSTTPYSNTPFSNTSFSTTPYSNTSFSNIPLSIPRSTVTIISMPLPVMPIPVPDPAIRASPLALSRMTRYIEPPDIGKYMKPGKAANRWGPIYHPPIHGIWYFIRIFRKTFPLAASRLWIEFQPYNLPCFPCRKSFSVWIGRHPVRTVVQDANSASLLFHNCHNYVTRKYNRNAQHAADEKKQLHSPKDTERLYGSCGDNPTSGTLFGGPVLNSKDPMPDAYSRALFTMLYIFAEHYPENQHPFAQLQQLRARAYATLFVSILPPQTRLSESLLVEFAIDEALYKLCHDPSTNMDKMEHELAKRRGTSPWVSSEALRHAIRRAELYVCGTSIPTMEQRLEFVALTIARPSIPIVVSESASLSFLKSFGSMF